MSRKVVLGRLQDAVSGQYPVRLERDQEWWADDINGFVVGVSDRWVAVQELADSVYVDGYEVVRMEDITDVEDDRESGYIERAVAGLGRPKVDFHLPGGPSTAEVLRSAADHSALICVYLEMEDDTTLLVGRITRLGDRKFDIQLIGPKGVWVVEPTRWWYKDVTRVEFGDRYSAALERFGEERPV